MGVSKALLDRIRKCLALAASSNEHEAAVALAKARALMDEHGVSQADVDLAQVEEEAARASRTMRPPKWESILSQTVCRAFAVIAFLDERGDRRFVGRGAAPAIAAYAFQVLFRQLKAARQHYIRSRLRRCKPGRKRARADAFCEGWAIAVFAAIRELVPEREADPLAERYLAERHPGLQTIRSREASRSGRRVEDDYYNGAAMGSEVNLNHGLDGVVQETPLIAA